MNTIDANEAYRRANARDLVHTMLEILDRPEDFDVDRVIDAVLDADPHEREFAFVDAQVFWDIAESTRTSVTVRISRKGHPPHIDDRASDFDTARRSVLKYARDNGLYTSKQMSGTDAGWWVLYSGPERYADQFYGDARIESTR